MVRTVQQYPAFNFDTGTLAALAIIFLILAILIYLDIIPIRKKRYLSEHKGPIRARSKLFHPTLGELSLTGGKEIGDLLLPVTKEFGKGNPLPINLKPFENTWPLNPKKLLCDDPGGKQWIYFEDDYPFEAVKKAMSTGYKRRDDRLLFENHYLKNELLKMSGEVDEMIRQRADLIGDIRKKTAIIVPEHLKKPDYKGTTTTE